MAEGDTAILSCEIVDEESSGVLDSATVYISWGDGQNEESFSLIPGQTSFERAHVYCNSGTWTATVYVTKDGHGQSDHNSITVHNTAPLVDAYYTSEQVGAQWDITIDTIVDDPGRHPGLPEEQQDEHLMYLWNVYHKESPPDDDILLFESTSPSVAFTVSDGPNEYRYELDVGDGEDTTSVSGDSSDNQPDTPFAIASLPEDENSSISVNAGDVAVFYVDTSWEVGSSIRVFYETVDGNDDNGAACWRRLYCNKRLGSSYAEFARWPPQWRGGPYLRSHVMQPASLWRQTVQYQANWRGKGGVG